MDTPLAPPEGNASLYIENLGCPCYSSSEPHYAELIAIRAFGPILGYIQEVAMTPGFTNPPISVIERPKADFTDSDWQNLPDENKPSIIQIDPEIMKREVKQARRWRRFEQTGEAPNSDSEDEDEAKDAQQGDKSVRDENAPW